MALALQQRSENSLSTGQCILHVTRPGNTDRGVASTSIEPLKIINSKKRHYSPFSIASPTGVMARIVDIHTMEMLATTSGLRALPRVMVSNQSSSVEKCARAETKEKSVAVNMGACGSGFLAVSTHKTHVVKVHVLKVLP